jgi:hypothetical protein
VKGSSRCTESLTNCIRSLSALACSAIQHQYMNTTWHADARVRHQHFTVQLVTSQLKLACQVTDRAQASHTAAVAYSFGRMLRCWFDVATHHSDVFAALRERLRSQCSCCIRSSRCRAHKQHMSFSRSLYFLVANTDCFKAWTSVGRILLHVDFQAHQNTFSSTTANTVSNDARSTNLLQAHKLLRLLVQVPVQVLR